MSWGNRFLAALEAQNVGPMRFVLESVGIGSYKPWGGSLSLSSHIEPGYAPVIAKSGHSITSGELRPGGWSASQGTLTVALTTANNVRRNTARGQIVQLRVGFAGWSIDEFEVVFTGQVSQLSWAGGLWKLQVRDIVSALTSRFTETLGEVGLFHDIEAASTTTTALYTPGNTTLAVTATSAWNANASGGYVIRMTGGAADFYLTATGKTATTFTGVSATGQYSTTATAVASTSTVYDAALISAHPIEAVRQILCSTGAGTNGDADVLPESWGMDIDKGIVDKSDMAYFERISDIASAGGVFDILSDAEVVNPLGWMAGWLAPAGYFLLQHQGQISCRAAKKPADTTRTPGWFHLTDGVIRAITSYQQWDTSYAAEYCSVKAITPGGSTTTTEAINSKPAINLLELNLEHIHADQVAWRAALLTRFADWHQRIPERLVIECAGFAAAQASAGDVIDLSTSIIKSRSSVSPVLDETPVLVLGSSVDWFGMSSSITVAILPDSATEV